MARRSADVKANIHTGDPACRINRLAKGIGTHLGKRKGFSNSPFMPDFERWLLREPPFLLPGMF